MNTPSPEPFPQVFNVGASKRMRPAAPTNAKSMRCNESARVGKTPADECGYLVERPALGRPLVIIFEASDRQICTTTVMHISRALDGLTTYARTRNSTYLIDSRSLMVTANYSWPFDAQLLQASE